MKKIAIIDTLTLTLDDSVYGHFHKVSLQLHQILSKIFDVKIIAGKTYTKYFDNSAIDPLPYITSKKDFDSKSFFIEIRNKLKSVVNTIFVLRKKEYDVLIFHDNNNSLLYFTLLFFKPNNHIILIRYTKNNSSLSNWLFEKIKNKISFIISSLDNVAISYGIDYILLPDYFPSNTTIKELTATLYDFVMVGTINECKDIEDVLESVLHSNLTLNIAGHFENELQYDNVINKYGNCERISITNKYLTEEEYENYIATSKFVLLPYKKDSYSNRSSGVILDAIYAGRSVIGSNIDAFQIIRDQKIGFIYNISLSEIIPQVVSCNYQKILKNVKQVRKSYEDASEKLLNKINELKVV